MSGTRIGIGIGVVLTLGGLGVLGLWVVSGAAPPPHVELDHSRPKPQGGPNGGSEGGFYTMALPEPAVLNPYLTTDGVARRIVLQHTHDMLMEYDPVTAKMRPALAEKLEVDGRKLRFTIRPDVHFSDGIALTMEDVVFAYELHQKGVKLGAIGGVLLDVASLEAKEPWTLEVELKSASTTAIEGFATGYIVAKKSFFLGEVMSRAGAEGESMPELGEPRFAELFDAVNRSGPGTGPYQFARWDRGQDLYLIQNPHSWRRAVRPEDWNLSGVRLLFLRDSSAAFVRARDGTLDLYSDPDAAKLLRSNPGLAKTHRLLRYDHRGNGHYFIVWNHRKKHLGKPAVRRALTMLFDRDAIVKEVFHGSAVPSRTWFRPGSELDLPAERAIPFDPKLAREHLDAASAGDLSVEILYPGAHPVHKGIMEIAIPAFQQAGIGLQASPQEFTVLQERLGSGDFDGMLLYIGAPMHIDPFYHFHGSQIEDGQNWMGYDDGEVNGLLKSAREEMDSEERTELLRQFNEIFLRHQPVTLIAHPSNSVILAKRFEGVKPGAMGLSWEKWWIEPAKAK